VSSFALLLVCFALGMALRRTQRLPEATPAALNGFIVHVCWYGRAVLYAAMRTGMRRGPKGLPNFW
jgi:hypothetical protein